MKKENTNFFQNIKKTWQYIKEAKWNLVGYATVSIIEAIIGAILPLISANIILNITDGMMEQLFFSALAVFGIEIILFILYYFKVFFYSIVYRKTLVNLQIAVARETLKLEVKEMDKESSGVFIDRLNRDTQDISGMFMEYTYWMSYVISNIGVLVAIFFLNHYFFIYAMFVSLSIFLINKKRLSKQYEIQKNLKKLQEKKTGLTSELVRGIRDIKVLNAGSTILKQASNKIVETSNEEIKMIKIRTKYNYYENNARGLTDFLFIVFGIFLYSKVLLMIPSFVILYNYQSKVKNLLTGWFNFWNTIKSLWYLPIVFMKSLKIHVFKKKNLVLQK